MENFLCIIYVKFLKEAKAQEVLVYNKKLNLH